MLLSSVLLSLRSPFSVLATTFGETRPMRSLVPWGVLGNVYRHHLSWGQVALHCCLAHFGCCGGMSSYGRRLPTERTTMRNSAIQFHCHDVLLRSSRRMLFM